jgi:major type 1 subunit fimbrin (pilin)
MKRILLCLIVLAGLLGLGREAHASCSFTAGNTLTSTIALPAQITVPRNVSRGTVLWDSGWVQGGSGTASILCNAWFYLKFQWNIPGLQPVSGMPNVYSLPDLPGVGIQASWFWGSSGSPGVWAWIGQPDQWTANTTQAYILRSFLSLQLVAIGPIRSGTQTFPSPTINVWYDNLNVAQLLLTQTSIRTLALSCVTPDVIVPMGKHMTSELSGPNTYTSAVDVPIRLNECPPGMDSIKYQIDPVTTVIDSGNSVVALDGTSTATGVGVQLLNSDATAAFPLGTPATFSGYNTSTGGYYTIPLKARYYQTDATVGAGKANTLMTFTMTYD